MGDIGGGFASRRCGSNHGNSRSKIEEQFDQRPIPAISSTILFTPNAPAPFDPTDTLTHKNSPSSAWKTPSAMNFLFLEIWEEVAILIDG